MKLSSIFTEALEISCDLIGPELGMFFSSRHHLIGKIEIKEICK